MTHLPTGIVVACQEERSQLKNRERAMTILKSKLYDHYQGLKDKEYKDTRKAQVGTGDRSERIRTYNFPQGRMTDHRVNYTEYNLVNFMNGDIESVIKELQIADQKAKLEAVSE
jgi:peptide chain release factor 1